MIGLESPASLLAAVVAVSLAQNAPAPPPPSGPPLALAGAKALRIHVAPLAGDPTPALDPTSPLWNDARATPLLLSRTPRLFRTESTDQPPPPEAEVRALRSDGRLLVRLDWRDATYDAPRPPDAPTTAPDSPTRLYKQPTGETSTFSDAAAVMLPEAWTGPAFPSLIMGDENSPARLYHGCASRGSTTLRSRGRSTTERLDSSFPAAGRHADGHWQLVVQIPAPDLSSGYPIAFAVWDGHHGDRDGLKFFSVWYVLVPGAPNQGGEEAR